MKKIYMSPETCIVLISTQAMIADSLPMDENKIDPGTILSRRGRRGRQRDVWDDEEEEEEY